MKQGDKYIRVIMAVLAVMICGYILYHLLGAVSSGVETVRAVEYTAQEGLSIRGVIVRREQALPGTHSLYIPLKEEGEKVARGEQVALCLENETAKDLYARMEELEVERTQLEYALSYDGSVQAALQEELGIFSAQTARARLSRANAAADRIKALLLRQNAGQLQSGSPEDRLAQVTGELAALKQRVQAGAVPVAAAQAGHYSREADGYEAVLTPEMVLSASREALQAALASGAVSTQGTAGRLITEAAWYYAGEAEPQYLQGLQEGDRLTVRLQTPEPLELTMTLCRADEAQGMLVLSCDQYLHSISALRQVQADVVFRSWEGLRVPKEALCYQEQTGQTGVYVLVNQRAVWKAVTPIYDGGDAFLVALDRSSTKNLWPEDQILVNTTGLYDGKVVN